MSGGFLPTRPLLTIFLGAVAVRWVYALIMYCTLGDAGLLVADSFGYLRLVNLAASSAMTGSLEGWHWLGPEISIMPLITWLWAASVMAFRTARL